MICNAVF